MKGNIDTRTFTQENNIIQMDGWLSTTLFNTGEENVNVMGITVKKGESFVMGNSTTKLYTEVTLQWPEGADSKRCKVVVHYIQPIIC